MPRARRIDYPGAWHHVMHRGARRAPIFKIQDDCTDFLDIAGEMVDRFGLVAEQAPPLGRAGVSRSIPQPTGGRRRALACAHRLYSPQSLAGSLDTSAFGRGLDQSPGWMNTWLHREGI